MKYHKIIFLLFFTVCLSTLPSVLFSQKKLSGVIMRYSKPEKNVKVTIDGFKVETFTDSTGKFSIELPEGARVLEFQEKDHHHKSHLKLQAKDSSGFVTVNLDKLLGLFTWNIDASLAGSSSIFSTYQSSGNNNNITTLLSKAIIHLDWNKGQYSWLTDFNLLYGESFTHLRLDDPTGSKRVVANAKSGDLLSITSKFAQQISKNFHLTALGNFQSQFAPGYSDPYALAKGKPLDLISKFLSPGTFNLGIGLDYRPNKYLSIYYSPCNFEVMNVLVPELRERYDLFDGSAAYEFGSFFNMTFRKEIFKNVNFSSKLQMFTNYLRNKKHPLAERPGSIDVQLFQNSLNYNVSKYFSISFTTTAIYDEDRQFRIYEGDTKLGANTGKTGPRLQYFHTFGLGINYSFQNKKH